MSAELLREAAELMRKRAEAASPSPWHTVTRSTADVWDPYRPNAELVKGLRRSVARADTGATAEHIASLHPDVALAVADWLEFMSKAHDDAYIRGDHSFVVARAYLGRDS